MNRFYCGFLLAAIAPGCGQQPQKLEDQPQGQEQERPRVKQAKAFPRLPLTVCYRGMNAAKLAARGCSRPWKRCHGMA